MANSFRFFKNLLPILLIVLAVLIFPSTLNAGEGWCWCTGPDATGNVCARTTPYGDGTCAAGGPVEFSGFQVCCSNSEFYNSEFALTSPVCGSSSEILPECSYDSSQRLVCWGNDFVEGGGSFPVETGFNGEWKVSGPVSYAGLTYPNIKDEIWLCSAGNTGCAIPVSHDNSPDPANTPPRRPVPFEGAPGGPPAPVPICSGSFPGTNQDKCFYEGNFSRPGGTCKERVPYVHTTLDQYTLSCAATPELETLSYRTCDTDEFNEVVVDYNEAARSKVGCDPTTDPNCYIDMRLLSSFNGLQLGSLGPPNYTPTSPDNLAQLYPYSGLADKPLYVDETTPKEAFRTWWRLLSLNQQMAAKAAFLSRVDRQFSLPAKFKRWIGQYIDVPIFKESSFPFDPTLSITEQDEEEATDNPPLPDNTGVNIGYGHTTPFFGQISSGKPVTFLVSLDSDLGTLQNYASLYSASNPRIVRVTGLEPSADDTYFLRIRDFAERLSSVFNRSGDITVFGNELNDTAEYNCANLSDCGRTYLEQFRVFKSALSGPIRAAAAPMNTSHATRDAGIFILAAKEAYQIADITAHNVYKLSGCSYVAVRCTTDSWEWEQQVTGTVGKQHIFTEYGLEPFTGDTDLNAVLEFITTGPSHPLAITPLIRNSCPSASGQWLLYDGTDIYDVGGQKVNPNCSASTTTPTITASEFKLSDLLTELPRCLKRYPLCSDAQSVYKKLGKETKAKYDAFQPFNFDNVRGYIGLTYIDPTTGQQNAGLLAENLPYVQALKDILSDPAGGILTTLSPDWLNEARYTAGLYTADTFGPIYEAEGPPPLQDEESDQLFATIINSYIKANWGRDAQCRVVDKEASKLSLASPLTYPGKLPVKGPFNQLPGTEFKDVLDQAVLSPVTVEFLDETNPNNTCKPLTDELGVPLTDGSGNLIRPRQYVASMRADEEGPDELPVRRKFGRTLVVLTNPKFTDFSRLIAGNLANQDPLFGPVDEGLPATNNALVPLLLPAGLNTLTNSQPTPNPDPDQAIYGPAVTYNSQHEPNPPGLRHKASAGDSGDPTAAVPRKAGLAQSLLCKLRNFWLRPAGLQTGTAAGCEDPVTLASAPPATTLTPTPVPTGFGSLLDSLSICDNAPSPSGHNVKPVDSLLSALSGTVWNPGASAAITSADNIRRCYNYVINTAKQRGADPALTMAVWIEESGASNYARFPTVDDLGCGGGISNNLSAQLNCFTGLQNAYANQDNHAQCRALNAPSTSLSVMEFFQIFACGDNACRQQPPHFDFSCTYTDSAPGTFNWPNQLNSAYRAVHTSGASLNFNKLLPSSNWSN